MWPEPQHASNCADRDHAVIDQAMSSNFPIPTQQRKLS